MINLVFATGNSGKLREASEILGGGFELVTPAQMGITEDIPETGDTLKANSRQKEYISLSQGDKAEIYMEEEKTVFDEIGAFFSSLWS